MAGDHGHSHAAPHTGPKNFSYFFNATTIFGRRNVCILYVLYAYCIACIVCHVCIACITCIACTVCIIYTSKQCYSYLNTPSLHTSSYQSHMVVIVLNITPSGSVVAV